jgi:hypothetical protein
MEMNRISVLHNSPHRVIPIHPFQFQFRVVEVVEMDPSQRNLVMDKEEEEVNDDDHIRR